MSRLACWLRGHHMIEDGRLRLMILNDSWPAEYTDGLGRGKGTRCARCGMKGVRDYGK
jgi:hypothetical protein